MLEPRVTSERDDLIDAANYSTRHKIAPSELYDSFDLKNKSPEMYEFFDAKRVVIVDVPGRRDAAKEGECRRDIEWCRYLR